MSKTKPSEAIAARFKISGESAKYFLGQVQKTFKTERPSQQLIVEFMAGLEFERLPTPHQLATLMYAGGVWVHPLHAAPAVPASEEEDTYF
jgi:hypothetical protein